MSRLLPTTMLMLALAGTATGAASEQADRAREVEAVELAFARTMAERDFEAFRSFVADEAVFLGPAGALRGRQAVADHWRRYFEPPEAPFSWRPETVEVLDSGALAISTGPVFDPAGNRVSTYTSIWRRDSDGSWRIVFDKGDKFCE